MERSIKGYFNQVVTAFHEQPNLFTLDNSNSFPVATCQDELNNTVTIYFSENGDPSRITFLNPDTGLIILDNNDGDIVIRKISPPKTTNS